MTAIDEASELGFLPHDVLRSVAAWGSCNDDTYIDGNERHNNNNDNNVHYTLPSSSSQQRDEDDGDSAVTSGRAADVSATRVTTAHTSPSLLHSTYDTYMHMCMPTGAAPRRDECVAMTTTTPAAATTAATGAMHTCSHDALVDDDVDNTTRSRQDTLAASPSPARDVSASPHPRHTPHREPLPHEPRSRFCVDAHVADGHAHTAAHTLMYDDDDNCCSRRGRRNYNMYDNSRSRRDVNDDDDEMQAREASVVPRCCPRLDEDAALVDSASPSHSRSRESLVCDDDTVRHTEHEGDSRSRSDNSDNSSGAQTTATTTSNDDNNDNNDNNDNDNKADGSSVLMRERLQTSRARQQLELQCELAARGRAQLQRWLHTPSPRSHITATATSADDGHEVTMRDAASSMPPPPREPAPVTQYSSNNSNDDEGTRHTVDEAHDTVPVTKATPTTLTTTAAAAAAQATSRNAEAANMSPSPTRPHPRAPTPPSCTATMAATQQLFAPSPPRDATTTTTTTRGAAAAAAAHDASAARSRAHDASAARSHAHGTYTAAAAAATRRRQAQSSLALTMTMAECAARLSVIRATYTRIQHVRCNNNNNDDGSSSSDVTAAHTTSARLCASPQRSLRPAHTNDSDDGVATRTARAVQQKQQQQQLPPRARRAASLSTATAATTAAADTIVPAAVATAAAPHWDDAYSGNVLLSADGRSCIASTLHARMTIAHECNNNNNNSNNNSSAVRSRRRVMLPMFALASSNSAVWRYVFACDVQLRGGSDGSDGSRRPCSSHVTNVPDVVAVTTSNSGSNNNSSCVTTVSPQTRQPRFAVGVTTRAYGGQSLWSTTRAVSAAAQTTATRPPTLCNNNNNDGSSSGEGGGNAVCSRCGGCTCPMYVYCSDGTAIAATTTTTTTHDGDSNSCNDRSVATHYTRIAYGPPYTHSARVTVCVDAMASSVSFALDGTSLGVAFALTRSCTCHDASSSSTSSSSSSLPRFRCTSSATTTTTSLTTTTTTLVPVVIFRDEGDAACLIAANAY